MNENNNDFFHIGSPFQFTVGPISGGGPHKVRAIGPGLERGEANKQSMYTGLIYHHVM